MSAASTTPTVVADSSETIDTVASLAREVMNNGSPEPVNAKQLQNAFAQFNQLSENFVNSYQHLEGKVDDLVEQLADEARSKQRQLVEKERMAKRLHSLLAILPVGVVVLDAIGKVQECNAMAVDLLGRPLLGEQWIDVIQRSFSPRLDDGHEISLKDGRRVRIETRSLDYEPGQLVVITDLTETRKLQDRVNRDKRLASMGRMMASLAHQIRTPLSSATLYAANLANRQADEQLRARSSEKLTHCLLHLERQVNDMLQFAKSGGLKKETMRLDLFVADLQTTVESIHPDISINLQEDLFNKQLLISKDALISAVMNLLDNAKQAAAKQTQPTVSLSLKLEPLTKGSFAFNIIVTDNGCGIPEAIKDKVLDPFYTTKSGGTGLGLAVVHGVVKAHDGDVDIDSTVDQGTRVTLTFPVVASESSSVPKKSVSKSDVSDSTIASLNNLSDSESEHVES